jgi:hypothetical protein
MQCTNLGLAGAALAVGFCCLSPAAGQAQAAPSVSNVAVVESSGQFAGYAAAPENDAAEEAKRNPMGWAGIGLKLGVAGVGGGKFTVMGQETRTEGRMGLHVALPINLGGDGFGWTLEPFFGQSSVGRALKDNAGNVVGDTSVNLLAVGIYTGPTINIHVMDPLYVGFGLGIKGAYLLNDSFQYAADVYGRVPVHATYYLSRKLALVAEVGFGYGASAYVDKPHVVVDSSGSEHNVNDDPKLGLAYTWDTTIGVRFP